MLDEIGRVAPRELVLGRGDADRALARAGPQAAFPRLPRAAVDDGDAAAELPRALGAAVRRRRSCERLPRAAAAAAAVLRYARATQPGAELPLAGLEVYARADSLILDEQARAHLELVETLQERRRAGSLLDLLDETRTAMGGRLLRRWLLFPSVDVAAIRRRHDAVERLVGAHAARDRARKLLGGIADLERLVGPGAARRGDAARSGGPGTLAGGAAGAGGGARPRRTRARSAAPPAGEAGSAAARRARRRRRR